MTSGAASRTASARRPGTSVRSTSHAATTPMVAQAGTARTSRARRCSANSSKTRGRKVSSTNVAQPRLQAVGRRCRRAGSARRRPRRRPPGRAATAGRRARRRACRRGSTLNACPYRRARLRQRGPPDSEDAGLGHQVGDPCCRASTDRSSAPRSSTSGTSAGFAATSLAMAYSNESPVCRIVWPSTPGDELQERLCRGRVLARLQDAATRDADERTRVLVLEVVQLRRSCCSRRSWPGHRTSSSGRSRRRGSRPQLTAFITVVLPW